MGAEHTVLSGIGVSAGTAVGPLVVVSPPPTANADEPPTTDAAAASETVRSTLQQVAEGLDERVAKATDHAKPILQATAMMARDPGLADGIDTQLKAGKGLTTAVAGAVDEYCAMFEALGGYMAERVTDLRDVRDRTIARLLGQAEPGIPSFSTPSILAAHDLAPAETATLTRETCLGIITEAGGPTSHTAILAAQLGIPAVVQVTGIGEVTAGTVVAIDGGVGEVILDPTEAEQQQLVERKERRERALAGGATGRGATKDGYPVALLANIGTAEDARKAAAEAVEGVGLFRTEFLFLDRDTMPTVEEQTQTYTEVLEAFGDRRVVVRTLDAGADKPLAFADLGPEENPALGRRGIRLGAIRTDILDAQLEALAAAYKAVPNADIRVMAPMIATVDETKWFVDKVRALGLPKAGVMIEVPGAAIRSKDVLFVADFASLGTNDLQQYTMAADRMQGELATLLNAWQPALLDVVAMACEGGQIMGKPVGVCGEAGGDPALALVLVGLGVSSLSMATGKVPAVRTSLGLHTLTECQQMAAAARASGTPEEAKAAVLKLADPVLLDLV